MANQPKGSKKTPPKKTPPKKKTSASKKPTCELVVNTCLHEARPEAADEGLRAYPTRSDEPLSQIRERPSVGAISVPIRPGQSLVMFGGIVPHEVLPMSAGQTRIMSLLCYAA